MKPERLKTLYELLLQKNYYLTERISITGKTRYCIFSGPGNPVMLVSKGEYNYLSPVLIKHGNIQVISRKLIRQHHGKSYLKTIYLKLYKSLMKSTEIDNIVKTFMSKAPKEYYMDSPQFTNNGVKYGTIHLFDGPDGKSMKIAALTIKGMSADHMGVELIVGQNSFEILDNPSLMIGLIDQFVPFQGVNLSIYGKKEIKTNKKALLSNLSALEQK